MAAPIFSSAYTSQDGLKIEIVLAGSGVTSILPASSAITGWSIIQDPAGAAIAIPVLTAYRKGASGAEALTVVLELSTRITSLEVLKVVYNAGNITDQTSAFSMANYAGVNGNCVNNTGRPVFESASTTIDGKYIDVVFSDYDNTTILPSNQGIPGFIVKVGGSGGVAQSFPNPIRKGNSGLDLRTVRITLTTPLVYTDSNIVVNYVPDLSVFITDNSAPPVPSLGFDYQTVTQNTIERIAPVFSNAYTSTDGYKIYAVFTEVGPPTPGRILPESINISGFTITEDTGSGYNAVPIVSAVRSVDTLDSNYRRTIIITLDAPLTYNATYKIAYANVSGKPKVTDGAIIPNNLAAFTSSPITNTTTYERIKPVFLNGTTSSTNLAVINFTEVNSVPLTPVSPNGFILRANGITIPFSITRTGNTQYTLTRTDYKSWSAEDFITIEYVKPETNYVTDAAPASNALDDFASTALTNAIVDNTSAPQFVKASTNQFGDKITVYIRENHSNAPYINPATNITGFYVKVNGVPRDILTAERGNSIVTSTDVNRTIDLTLAYKVGSKDVITLNYYNGNVVDVDTDSTPNNLANFTTLVENQTKGKIFGTNIAYVTFDTDSQFRKPQFDILRSYGIQWIREYQIDGPVDLNPGTQSINRSHGVTIAQEALLLGLTPSIVLADSNYGIESSDGVNFTAANFTAFKNRFSNPTDLSNVRRAMLCAAIAGNLTTVLNWVLNDISLLNEMFPFGTVGEIFNGPKLDEWRYQSPNGGCPWDAFERVLSGARGSVTFNGSGNVTAGSALSTTTDFATFCAALPVPINFTAASEATLKTRFADFKASVLSRWTKGSVLSSSVLVEHDDSATLNLGNPNTGFISAFNYRRYDSVSGDPVINRGEKQLELASSLYDSDYYALLLDEWTERSYYDVTFAKGPGKTMPLWTSGMLTGSLYELIGENTDNYSNLGSSHLCIDQTDCADAIFNIAQLFTSLPQSSDNDTVPFDVLNWVLSGASELSNRKGYLLERRLGWPLASTILDTTPPVGNVVINENPGSGGIKVHHFASYGATSLSNVGGGQDDLNNKYEATQFLSSGTFDISSINIKLKKSGTITNQSERITVSLYSDSGDKPLQQLITSTDFVSYGELTDTFTDFEFKLNYRLENNTNYWIVVYRSAIALGSGAQIYISTKSPASGEYAISSDASNWILETGKSIQYEFMAVDTSAQPQSSHKELQDALETPLYEIVDLGGADNETEYELIGIGNRRFMVMNIDKILENNILQYPEISSIEVGLTADKAKNYIVEVRTTTSGSWVPLFSMIADKDSRDYMRYTFASPVRLAQARINYKGDFYTNTNDGTITIAGYDPLTDVVAFQASHYTDFHDAINFPNADDDGWVPFNEGISQFDWEMVNQNETWMIQDGESSGSALRDSVIFNGMVITYDYKSLYTFTASGALISRYIVASNQEPILSIAVHKNTLYVGLSNGKILKTIDGRNYVDTGINTITAPVRALISYRGKLWIGTGRNNDNLSRIYTWDTLSLTTIRTFVQPLINNFAISYGKLFVGTGSDSNLSSATIYYFDGNQWSLTLSVDAVNVNALQYSTATSQLWAGFSGGSIYVLSFKEDTGDLISWNKTYDSDANTFYSISDDPNGDYVWLCSDTGLTVYNKVTASFNNVSLPAPEMGLQSIWTNSDISNYLTLNTGLRQIYYNDGPINWTDLSTTRPASVNSTYFNTVWEQYIIPSQTANWKFYSNTTNGVSRLYVNGQLIIDEVTNPAITTGWAQMTAGKPYKFRYEFFKDGVSGGSVVLNWQPNGVGGISNIPIGNFGKPNQITKIIYIGAASYALCQSGVIYLLDTSNIATKKRIAYVRFKDSAGNTTELPGLNDSIIQDSPTRNGVRISDGNIYQINVNDKRVLATFTSPVSGALYSPKRKTRVNGTYESEPFYSPTLTRWDKISFLAVLPAGTYQEEGLDVGVEVVLQIRSGNTKEECLAAEWGNELKYSTIVDPGLAGTVDTALNGDFSIAGINNKWIQYKATLVTATRGETPELKAVILSYLEANASYFFTTVFDTAAETESPYPQFRRGLLTANMVPNGGVVRFGYTVNTDTPDTFNFANYTEITPNTVFELPNPSQYIRFGILLVSIMSEETPDTLYIKSDCVVATTAALPSTASIIYANGTAGVGATLTRGENGALGTIDGITLSVNDRVLVKNQVSALQNGIYIVTNLGSGGAPYVLTRSTDADQATTDMRYGLYTSVTSGLINKDKNYFLSSEDPITMGTTALVFTEFTPAIVDDFGIQLDAGPADMKFMD